MKFGYMAVILLSGLLGIQGSAQAASAGVDAASNLPAALKSCYSGHGPCIINLSGRTVHLTHGVVINPLRVTLQDGRIDASALPPGEAALTISTDSETVSDYGSFLHYIKGIRLIGNENADGIVFNSVHNDNILAAAMTLENMSISGFRRGITFANHCYGFGLSHIQIFNNKTGIYTMPAVQDAGERITFVDVGVFNNQLGIDDEGGFEMDWVGGHWDYNGRTAILSALVEFDGHIEIGPSTQPVIELRALPNMVASQLYMTPGSFVMVNGYNGKPTSDAWILSNSPYNVVQFPFNTWGVTGREGVMKGPGKVQAPVSGSFTPH